MVEPERQVPRAAQVQPGPARLYPRRRDVAFRPGSAVDRLHEGIALSRYRLRRRSSVRTHGPAWRRRARRGRLPHQCRSRPHSFGEDRRGGRLSLHIRRSTGRGRRDVRRRSEHGGRRACRRCRAVHAGLLQHGEARRADVRRHHQSHGQGLRTRHRRRRICAWLAAQGHAPVRQAGQAIGAG